MRVGITGSRSTIAKAFARMAEGHIIQNDQLSTIALDCDAYLICTGFLAGKDLANISAEAAELTWRLNYLDVAAFLDRLFAANDRARVCVMGSESGFAGSYDMAYAGAKAALHRYVETKKLYQPEQMLVALAPHIIWDSGMTQARSDLDGLRLRGATRRMGRWLTADEVAKEAAHLLFHASPSLSGQVIRMRP